MGFFDFLFGKKEKPFVEHGKSHEHCNFGMKSFNKTKRSDDFINEINTVKTNRGKKPGGSSTTTTTTTQPPSGTGDKVIYLDFEGSTVTGTSWNYTGPIVASNSGLGEYEKEVILQNAIADYAKYDVVVTRDKALYDSAPYNKRIRCIITQSWEWYCGASPCAGGVAYVGSFTWGDNTPCWVFSSALGYSTKNIQEAVSHEVGHTMGLRHQADWSDDCTTLISSYDYGCCGWAPIMGVGYYQPSVEWTVGPTPNSCTVLQDDDKILTQTLGLK